VKKAASMGGKSGMGKASMGKKITGFGAKLGSMKGGAAVQGPCKK
jgi:hypothetical protein